MAVRRGNDGVFRDIPERTDDTERIEILEAEVKRLTERLQIVETLALRLVVEE
jgi:hypothetical protein